MRKELDICKKYNCTLCDDPIPPICPYESEWQNDYKDWLKSKNNPGGEKK